MEGQARCKMAGLCAREEAAQGGGYTSHTVIIELARVFHTLMWTGVERRGPCDVDQYMEAWMTYSRIMRLERSTSFSSRENQKVGYKNVMMGQQRCFDRRL